MRMASDCYVCILERAGFECELAMGDLEEEIREERSREVMEELVGAIARQAGGVPALVGTDRERIVKRVSEDPDPYRRLKAESNLLAKSLLPLAEQFYMSSPDRTEALIRIAAAANSMEFGVKGHDFDNHTFGEVFSKTLRERLDGGLECVKELLSSFQRIYYLTDNAGEVVFDLFVVERLEEMGKSVIMGPKAEPVLNDVTAEELQGLAGRRMVATGDVVGLSRERSSPQSLALLDDPDVLIIAKGMGNFETISEFENDMRGRLVYILRAKCLPVARHLGVAKGTLVVRAVT